ncbi:Modification methylase MboII, partial [Haemophilus influenzae]
MADKAP